jgi:hypothetical protein
MRKLDDVQDRTVDAREGTERDKDRDGDERRERDGAPV